MKRFIEKVRAVPWWGWALGLVYFGLQYGIYRLGDLLSRVLGTKAWAFPCKIPVIDDAIPLVPIFTVVYLVFSYLFWISGPIVASLTRRRNFVNYLAGLSLAYIVGFLFFVFMPTYMDRAQEGLLEAAARPGFFHGLLRVIYDADGSSLAFNLFPSYHCMISAYCWLGVRRQPEISKGYQAFALGMAILISLSTVFTKQHYFIDIPGGWAVALGCCWLMQRLDPGGKWEEKRGIVRGNEK